MMTTTTTQTKAFQIKGGPVTLTTLHLQSNNLTEIAVQLAATIAQSPTFFANAPIVIDFNQLAEHADFNLDQLVQLLRQHSLIPIGIRSKDETMRAAAILLSLATFSNESPLKQQTDNQSKPASADSTDKSYQPTKVITQPIRSGQQIYAKDADLLVLSSVSPGSEILADGNIYVYGTLRGRALAGINGNKDARILCQALDAELISVAGHYQISENIKKPNAEGTIHIYLENEHLCISCL